MQIEESRLSNGLRVLTARLPGFESATVAAFVRAGSRYETAADGGTAHFLEHMAFKGTTHRSALQIASEIECLGASVNANTSKEVTAYLVAGLRSTIGDAVAILGDVLTHSTYDAGEIATERGVVLQEIRLYEDNPGAVASHAFARTAFPDQAIGRPILGSPEFIARIGRDDIVRFVEDTYSAENTVLVGVGDFEHAVFLDLVARHFAELPVRSLARTKEPARYVGGSHIDRGRSFEQVTILLGFPSVAERDPQAHAYGLLASAVGHGLSSPLFQEVRQKRGLAYAVSAHNEEGADYGIFSMYAGTTPQHVAEVLEVACGELLKATREIDERDFMRARNTALAHLATVRESPMRVARGIAWSLFTRGKPLAPEELMAELRAVTVDDMKAAAAALVQARPVLSLVGPVAEGDYEGLVRSALG